MRYEINYQIEDGPIIHNGKYITDDFREFTELARQWYGDKVTFSITKLEASK